MDTPLLIGVLSTLGLGAVIGKTVEVLWAKARGKIRREAVIWAERNQYMDAYFVMYHALLHTRSVAVRLGLCEEQLPPVPSPPLPDPYKFPET